MSDLVVFSRKDYDAKGKKSAIVKHLKSRKLNLLTIKRLIYHLLKSRRKLSIIIINENIKN